MTTANFPACLAFTLTQEGGFTDNPHDPGGATNKGITLTTFRGYLAGATVTDLKSISDHAVETIYRQEYWTRMSCDALPTGIDLMTFDFGVNAGPATSIKILQHALDENPDGVIGPVTLAELKGRSVVDLIISMTAAQRAHYRSLDDFSTFGRGWMDRTSARVAEALRMAGQAK